MRTSNKKSMVMDPQWDGIDFSSDQFTILDQQVTKGLNALVAKYLEFAHTHQVQTVLTQRGVSHATANGGN